MTFFSRRRFLQFVTGLAASCSHAFAAIAQRKTPQAMSSVTLPFEKSEISLPLPDGWRILDTVRPVPHAKLADVKGALVHALEHPIGAASLGGRSLAGKRIVLCVDDVSRPTPTGQYFGTLVEYLLSHGAERENMLVLFGLGVHRDMTPEEARKKFGDVDLHGIQWRNHAFHDEKQLHFAGTTSRGTHVSLNRHLAHADIIIPVGAIEPHLLLGFSGGCKMLIPGLASARTIGENHMQGVSGEHYNFVGATESPMRLDLEEGAQLLGKEIFIVNVVLNDSLEICRFFVGHPIHAHREGVKFSRSLAERPVPAQADVVIVASDPMNADLRQSMKCVGNAQKSVRPDGLIIGLIECRHGIGDVTMPPKSLPNGVLRGVLKLVGRNGVLGFLDFVRKDAGIEERFLSHFSAQVARRNKVLVYSRKLPADTGKKLGIFVQFDSIEKMMKLAKRSAPRNATVLVYPHGGSTYPRLPADSPA
jgi:nickel-dependent lactate racemase